MKLYLFTFTILLQLLNHCVANTSIKTFQWQASVDQSIYAPFNQVFPEQKLNTTAGLQNITQLVNNELFLIAVRDPDCPISRKYAKKLNDLSQIGLKIIFLLVGELADKKIADKDQLRHNLSGVYILDKSRELGTWLGVETSAEVYLFNKNKKLQYRGAIDDQYGIGFNKDSAEHNFLKDAIDALRHEQKVELIATSAPGCILRNTKAKNNNKNLSWHKDISPLIKQKCLICHRPGQAGPFSLITYQDVYKRKEMVRFVLANKIMPPWSLASDTSRFENQDKYLADSDRQKIIDWIDSGAAKGKQTNIVVNNKWSKGWKYGKPDVVLHSPKALDIAANGEIDYFYVSIPTNFSEDRYVHTVEIATDTPENTHHIIIFALPPEQLQDKLMPGMKKSTILTRKEYGLMSITGLFSGYIPGFPGVVYQNGSGKLLPQGWRLIMQVHYEPNGKAAKDRPRVGLHFLNKTPNKVINTLSAVNFDISIPAHTNNHLETAEYIFKTDGEIHGLYPHMHLRGSAFKYEMVTPNGEKQIILEVPNYDPNWQQYYQFREPLKVSKNSKLVAHGWFDNSANNLNNPDPNAEVKFGLRTKDEMLIGYFDWVEKITR